MGSVNLQACDMGQASGQRCPHHPYSGNGSLGPSWGETFMLWRHLGGILGQAKKKATSYLWRFAKSQQSKGEVSPG